MGHKLVCLSACTKGLAEISLPKMPRIQRVALTLKKFTKSGGLSALKAALFEGYASGSGTRHIFTELKFQGCAHTTSNSKMLV